MVTNADAQRWMWEQAGIVALHERAGIEALDRALASQASVVATFYGDRARISKRLGEYARVLPQRSARAPAKAQSLQRADVERYLMRVVSERAARRSSAFSPRTRWRGTASTR